MSRIYLFETRNICQDSWTEVMTYAGATKAPIQSTSISTQTYMSRVGSLHVTRRQRPAASSASKPVPSVSRSVGTTTRMADVMETVACCCLPTPLTSGGSSIFPLVVHQPASPSICMVSSAVTPAGSVHKSSGAM